MPTSFAQVGLGDLVDIHVKPNEQVAFGLNSDNNTLISMDVSSPENPIAMDTLQNDCYNGNAVALNVTTGEAYIVDRTNHAMCIVDIGAPSSLEFVGGVSSSDLLEQAARVTVDVSRSEAYVCGGGNTDDLARIDITDLENPQIVDALTSTNFQSCSIERLGNFVFTSQNIASPTLQIVDLTDFSLRGSLTWTGQNFRIDDQQDFLYGVDNSDPSSLEIVNITDKDNPSIESTLSLNDRIKAIEYWDETVFLGGNTDNVFVTVNVTNRSSPTQLDSITNSGIEDAQNIRLVLSNHAYVSQRTAPKSLSVIDTSDTSNVAHVETFGTLSVTEADVSADLSTTIGSIQAHSLKTSYVSDSEFNISVLQSDSEETRVKVFDETLTTLSNFNSCNNEDLEPSQEAGTLTYSYDSWILISCSVEGQDDRFRISLIDEEEGFFAISDMTPEVSHPPVSLDAKTLNRVYFSTLTHQFKTDFTEKSLIRQQSGSQTLDEEFIFPGQLSANHNTSSNIHVGWGVWTETISPISVSGLVQTWTDIGGVQQVNEERTDSTFTNFQYHHPNVWVVNVTENEDRFIERWNVSNSSDVTIEATENVSGTVTQGLEVSKDGNFLLHQDTASDANAVRLYNARNLTELALLETSQDVEGFDMDFCNNFVFVVSDPTIGGDKLIERFPVFDFTNSTAGDGSPNPCPSSSPQQEQETTGEVESDADPGADEILQEDEGMLGTDTFQGIATSLGTSINGARFLMAGMLIAGMTLGAASLSRQQATQFVDGSSAAFAGALAGFVISFGLGLIPLWFVLALVTLASAFVVFRGRF